MKVGDYVRTKTGEIAKIDECLGKDCVYKNMQHYETDRMVTKFNNFILYEEDIIKSSPNIIDLIEVGDYVNGYKVTGAYSPEGIYVLRIKLSCNPIDNWENEDIKSIVTKEQFESMKYNLESEVN